MKRDQWFAQPKNEEKLLLLVQELSKDKPRENIVRKLMSELNLSYQADHLTRLEYILGILSGVESQPIKNKARRQKESGHGTDLR